MQRFIDKRTEWNRPIWCGEMGEPQTLDWPERAVTLLESNGIGWTYWPWKKMNTNNDPYSIDVPTDWNSFVGIVANPGSQPDAGTLQDVLDDYLARIPVDKCQYNVLAAGCIATYVGQICEGVPSVLVDNRGGAKQLVDHLLSVHHFRRFTYIAGPRGHQESEERLDGTRERLAAHGLVLPAEAVLHGDFSTEFGVRATHEFIRRRLCFDVIVAANDDMALGALDALRSHGLMCPGQIAVVGFDDAVTARVSDLRTL